MTDNEQILNEIRDKAREKFSDEEIDNIIHMGSRLTGVAVLSLVQNMITEKKESGSNSETANSLYYRIEEIKPKDFVTTQIEFEESPLVMRIGLIPVDRDYKTVSYLPSDKYAQDLINQFTMIKGTAQSYWNYFVQKNTSLVDMIKEYLNVNLLLLTVDPLNPTTMFFDADSKYRVGIIVDYLEPSSGKTFAHKNQLKRK